MIHLDTSFLIRALLADTAEDTALRRWVRDGEDIGISAVAWSEFLCGPLPAELRELAEQIRDEPAPLGISEAVRAALLFNESGRRRGSLVDCFIAATALEAGALLATSNRADFRKLEPLGLKLATT